MRARRKPMPEPRRLPWALKPFSSAQTSLTYDRLGRMVMHIRHDVLHGVTPEMVAWWFANIGGAIEIDGARYENYLVWHPFDHIDWSLARPGKDGGASVGAQFHIVEAFGRDPNFYVDVVDTVERLDPSGVTLTGKKFGLRFTALEHDFIAVAGGTQYVSTLTIGLDTPILRAVINPLMHRFFFSEAMGCAWLKHNVEEVGLLEHILPLIYPRMTEHLVETAGA